MLRFGQRWIINWSIYCVVGFNNGQWSWLLPSWPVIAKGFQRLQLLLDVTTSEWRQYNVNRQSDADWNSGMNTCTTTTCLVLTLVRSCPHGWVSHWDSTTWSGCPGGWGREGHPLHTSLCLEPCLIQIRPVAGPSLWRKDLHTQPHTHINISPKTVYIMPVSYNLSMTRDVVCRTVILCWLLAFFKIFKDILN